MSFLLVEDGRAWTDTDAIVQVLRGLGGGWRVAAAAFGLFPRSMRDRLYRVLARNRYRWFGRREHCLLPTPRQAVRFLP